ncbi:MAG: hypothetical protein IPL92_19215 [Saprospiraceae bacterium]|nr:hypothetical protein [Candidatus Opimibacter iunctus]
MKKQLNQLWSKRTILLSILLSATLCAFSQQKSKPNPEYNAVSNVLRLDSIFPIDDIKSITVSNNSGTHTLTQEELVLLKEQLKEAKSSGSLSVKPGHITLSIELQTKTKAKPGWVYAYTGIVNFDGGTDKYGKGFSATFYLPLDINFDNYKGRF